MTPKIIIPEGKILIRRVELDSPQITAPNGDVLFVSTPQNTKEFESAWQVLVDYTKRIAPNPESALQDIDEIANAKGYHFGKDLGYVLFTALDENNNPVAVAPSQIASIKTKGIGFIYQIGHNDRVSLKDTNFSVATQLYGKISNLLVDISKYQEHNWLGTVTESRKEGPELEAILEAGFDVLVPNEFYSPPAVQHRGIKDKENLTTKDLVLLSKNTPEDHKLQLLIAETYLKFAYCEGQDLGPTLKPIRAYFAR